MKADQFKRIIEACYAQFPVRRCTLIPEGWDNLVVEVNGEYIFRFPRRPEAEAQLRKELRLLPQLAPALSVSVPRYEFLWQGGQAYPRPFAGYWKVPGVPLALDSISDEQTSRLVNQLAEILSEVHSFPVEQAVSSGMQNTSPAQWREQYRALYRRAREQVLPLLEPPIGKKATALWESFLGQDANFRFRATLVHGDLGRQHILCGPDQGVVVGIIDWGDACIGDAALDFAGLLTGCSRAFVERVLVGYTGEVDETFRQRMAFYGASTPFHEVLFGLTTDDREHLTQGLASLHASLSD